MQYLEDGPDIPEDVLADHEDGRIVFFCGAGVSASIGLPLFEGLFSQVAADLGADGSRAGQGTLTLDGRFSELQEQFGSHRVRDSVTRILEPEDNVEPASHRALAALARHPLHGDRLVTTNFDRLFERAGKWTTISMAPTLPVPKRARWSGLVYLHGCIDEVQNPDGIHLVLTSGDIGRAYLIERWASRFISELLNQFTVLFVGYSLEDPMMRYITDALAAERVLDPRVKQAYVFASFKEGDRANEATKWRGRGLLPILYSWSNDHHRLNDTLLRWADDWRNGVRSKINTVVNFARLRPSAMPDREIGQMLWALNEPSAVDVFADPETPSSFEWVSVLDKAGRLGGQPRQGESRAVALVGEATAIRGDGELSGLQRRFAGWLGNHVNREEFARWVVQKGGHLHPHVAFFVRKALRERQDLSPPLRTLWRVLTGGIPICSAREPLEFAYLMQSVSTDPWSTILQIEILNALSPFLSLRTAEPLPNFVDPDAAEPDPEPPRRLPDIVSTTCALSAEQLAEELIRLIDARPDHELAWASMAFELTQHLLVAMNFEDSLVDDGGFRDRTWMIRPSIPNHQQNDHDGLSLLIGVVWESFVALLKRDELAAGSLAALWRSFRFPVFRRLVLQAATNPMRVGAAGLIDQVIANSAEWLWAHETQHELFGFLRDNDPDRSEREQRALEEAIADGPARELFAANLSTEDWEQVRDRAIFDRLERMSGVTP